MRVLGHHVVGPALLLAVLDGALFVVCLYVMGFAGTCRECYFHSVTHLAPYQSAILTAIFLGITAGIGLYNRDALLEFRVFFGRFLLASQFVLLPAVTTLGIAKVTTGAPFGWYMGVLTIAIALFFTILLFVRIALLWAVDLSFLKRRVMVLGDSAQSDSVIDFIRTEGKRHLQFAGKVPTSYFHYGRAVAHGAAALQQEQEWQVPSLVEKAQDLKADEIVIATSDRRGMPVWDLLECKLQGVAITEYLNFWERETGRLDLDAVGAGWLAVTNGFRLSLARRGIKRAIDVSVSLVFLTLTLPIFVLVALAIKLDSKGPIFYRQERVGRDGKIFRIWKFRSMRVDAESDGIPRWATVKDDRTTRIGRLIRKCRIDEFPQVFNVLCGDMSFIGPRPERPFFVDQLRKVLPLYDLRHRVRPGITGWAQICHHYGASIEDGKRKLAYDLYYVKNQDSILDAMILLQTVRVLLFAHGGR